MESQEDNFLKKPEKIYVDGHEKIQTKIVEEALEHYKGKYWREIRVLNDKEQAAITLDEIIGDLMGQIDGITRNGRIPELEQYSREEIKQIAQGLIEFGKNEGIEGHNLDYYQDFFEDMKN